MANIYPSQERHIDSYATYYSDTVNKLTRIVSLGNNCILSNDQIDVVSDSTALTTHVIITSGSCIKDDVLIEILNDFNVDFQEQSFYVAGTAFNEPGVYYIVIDFTYVRAKPAPQASIKILKPSQHAFLTSQYLFLKAVNVIFTGSVFEIQDLLDYDISIPTNKRVYSKVFASLENVIPPYDSLLDKGRFIYDRSNYIGYFGGEDNWQPLGTFDYECDTSICSQNQLVYIGAGNQAHPAIATSPSTLAIAFVLHGYGSSGKGRVRLTGRIDNGLVETGITISEGDTLYLSAIEAGKVTNIVPSANPQIIGTCVHTTAGNDYSCILCSLTGAVGSSISHNFLSGLEGGGSGHFYHLTTSQHTNLGDCLHNSIAGIQGGDSTSVYHLTYDEYDRVTSFGGNHNGLPTGLQGGNSTERYHFTQIEHDNLVSFGGNHNNILTGLQGGSSGEYYHLTKPQHDTAITLQTPALYSSSLKSYMTSLLSYEQDNRNLKDKYDATIDSGLSHIYADVVTENTNGSFVEQNGLENTCQTFNGIFGLINNSYFRSYSSSLSLSEGKSDMGGLSLTYRYGIIAGGKNASFIINSVDKFDNSTATWYSRTPLNYVERAPTGLTFNSDFGNIIGGYSSGGYSTSNQRYQDSTNTWIDRLVFSGSARNWASGISLTSSYGLIAGGTNSTDDFNDSYLFNESANTWTSKNSMIYSRYACGHFSLTEFSGIVCGGYNASNLNCNELYNYNLNSWTSKTPLLISNSYMSSLSMTSDIGVVIGGDLEANMRFSNSQNSWTPRPSHMGRIISSTGISQTSDEGLIVGGETSAYKVTSVLKYKDTEILSLRSGFKDITTICETPTPMHHYVYAEIETNNLITQTDPINKVVISSLYNKKDSTDEPICHVTMGGGNYITTGLDSIVDTSTLLPKDSLHDYTSLGYRSDFSVNADGWGASVGMSSSTGNIDSIGGEDDWLRCIVDGSAGQHYAAKNRYANPGKKYKISFKCYIPSGQPNIRAVQLYIDGGFVYASSTPNNFDVIETVTAELVAQHNGALLAFAISLDDEFIGAGDTFYIKDIVITEVAYQYKLSVFLRPDANVNTWASRTNMPEARYAMASFAVDSNTTIAAAGYNGGVTNNSYAYSDINNAWTSTIGTITSSARSFTFGFKLSNYFGIIAGGTNSSASDSHTDRYTNSLPSAFWTQRSDLNVERSDPSGFPLNYQQGLINGGSNSASYLNSSERYSDILDSWIFRNPSVIAKDGSGGISLTSNFGVLAGGSNSAIQIPYVERYSDSDNTWNSRTELIVTKDDMAEMSFNYNTGMICAGTNTYSSPTNESQLYSNAGNVWSMRANLITGRAASSGSSMSSHLGLVIGGANPSMLSVNERYTYGEVSFMGFATIPLI